MAKYHVTQDDGKGGKKKTVVSRDGKYKVTTNNPDAITNAHGELAVGNNSKITINHANGKTEVWKNGKQIT
jgi:hypothetical protein